MITLYDLVFDKDLRPSPFCWRAKLALRHKGLSWRDEPCGFGEKQKIDAPGMFVAIGHTPNTKFLNGQLKTDSQGFIVLKDPSRTTTSVAIAPAAWIAKAPARADAATARSRRTAPPCLRGAP